jgi:hypothetical protein
VAIKSDLAGSVVCFVEKVAAHPREKRHRDD